MSAKPKRVIITLSFPVTWDEASDRVLIQTRRDEQEKELLLKAKQWKTQHDHPQHWDTILRPGYITFEGDPITGVYMFHGELWLVENNFLVEPARYLPMPSDHFDDITE